MANVNDVFANNRIKNFQEWYTSHQKQYDEFAKHILSRISSYLKQQNFLNVAYSNSRAKSIESAMKKARKTVIDDGNTVYKYNDPKNDIMDLAGIRIVVYLPSDIEVVTDAIKYLFKNDIRLSDSENKLERLGNDKVGYLSTHYVVELKNPEKEYNAYKNFKCEIQVRTVLQDAWAQIFHDRVYKCAIDKVDDEIGRKVNLLAGGLELLDRQINDIVCILDNNPENTGKNIYHHLLGLPISKESLVKYINIKSAGKCEKSYDMLDTLRILDTLGYKYIKDFDNIVDEAFLASLLKTNISLTADKVVRYILLIFAPDEFMKCLENSKYVIDNDTLNLLKCYVDMDELCLKYNIRKIDKEEVPNGS